MSVGGNGSPQGPPELLQPSVSSRAPDNLYAGRESTVQMIPEGEEGLGVTDDLVAQAALGMNLSGGKCGRHKRL
jgi:hypothetical protein